MNLILEKTDQVRCFTNMKDVLDAASLAPQDYDWYISDIETNWKPPGFTWDHQWMTGSDLAELLNEHNIQFIWAVFSAVPRGHRSVVSTPSKRRRQRDLLGRLGTIAATAERSLRNCMLGQQCSHPHQSSACSGTIVPEAIQRYTTACRSTLKRMRLLIS